jgi:hypothetical protein
MPCNHLPGLNLEMWKDGLNTGPVPPPPPPRPAALVSPSSNPTPGCTIGRKQVGVGGAGLQSPCVSCVCRPDGVKKG